MELNNDGSVEEFDTEIFSPSNVASTIERLTLELHKRTYLGSKMADIYNFDDLAALVNTLIRSDIFPYMLEYEHIDPMKRVKTKIEQLKKKNDQG